MKSMHFSRILVLPWLALLLPLTAATAAGFAPTQSELAVLPPYCAARLNEPSPAFKSWQDSMGGGFLHIHHYCFALNFVNRARGMASARDRQGQLGSALLNFNYVLRNTQPDFYLRPEILMNRGIALSMMNRTGEAIGDLMKSIETDQKQPRDYMTLADVYSYKLKNRAKALETITEGLRPNPDSKSLQRRYTELGGKLPYPAPIKPAPVVVPADTDATPAAESGSTPPPVNPADGAAPPAAGTTAAPPPIGSPTNPYCRF